MARVGVGAGVGKIWADHVSGPETWEGLLCSERALLRSTVKWALFGPRAHTGEGHTGPCSLAIRTWGPLRLRGP